MAAVATDTIVLNIGDMIDMAIGSPEVGVVDFNMLQTVLHCLAQQQHIRNKPVEVRGVNMPLGLGRINSATINVAEFAVGTDGTAPVAKVEPPGPRDHTMLVVQRVKRRGEDGQAGGPTQMSVMEQAVQQQAGSAGQEGGLTVVTVSKFNLLESHVQDLQKRVYGSIPKNEAILEEVRSQTNIKAIQDMWTNLNVSARLEAVEQAIEKLSSLVQYIINESAGMPSAIAHDVSTTVSTGVGAPAATAMGIPSKEDMAGLMNFMSDARNDLDKLTGLFYEAMAKLKVDMDLPPMTEKGLQLEEIMAPRPTQSEGRGGGIDGDVLEVMERLLKLEKRIDLCCKTLGKNDGVISDQMTSFQDQLEYLAKQVANLSNLSAGNLTPDLIRDLQGMMQLFQTVRDMQDQLKEVHDTARQLAAEKEDRKHHINVLLEQIELLKTIKLDREDMAEAMAEKADLRMLARKVSHDQFEMACDDLSRGLEHALGKLHMQESLWQQALDDIQREIETKLDKLELSPVKEFFNNKLKQLQESLKQMASLRREAEAAGTKRKLLRDLNCLSCDANAVMASEAPPAMPVPKPFPAALSMKPYLSYELDTIRKTQASSLPQRNMHDWENIDKQMAQQPKQLKVRSGADKHLCNRYCGGSHTTTTPAQRVARLGHFIKQWGPDVLPLSSGFAAGDDGRMYRVQTEGSTLGPGGAVDTCTPKTPRKPDLPQISSEKLIAEDCKCLEAPTPGGKK